MPQRPRSHILEEESRRAFRRAMPAEWVVREQTPDYGLDEHVEIFEGNHATPFFFYAQIKASDGVDRDHPTYRFESERLRYFLQCHFPVMLVLYDSHGGGLYYRWVSQLYRTLPVDERTKWDKQETVLIPFSSTERLDGKSIQTLAAEVRIQTYRVQLLPDTTRQLVVRVSSDSLNADAISAYIARRCSELPHLRFVRIETYGAHHPDVLLRVGRSEITVSTSSASETFTFPRDADPHGQDILDTVMLTVGWALADCGFADSAIDVLMSNVSRGAGELPLSVLCHPWVWDLFSRRRRESDCITLAERIAELGNPNAGMFLLVRAVGEGRPYHAEQYRRFLETAIRVAENPTDRAVFHYNLANSLSNAGEGRRALREYKRAARDDVDYRRREYWLREVGACLFGLDRPLYAVRFYRAALDVGTPRRGVVLPRLADALLHGGLAGEAAKAFSDAFKECPSEVDALWILRGWVADRLAARTPTFVRSKHAAVALASQAITEQPDRARELLIAALERDPLCGLAWFNYAVTLSNVGDPHAGEAWLTAATIQERDVEAWGNAIGLILSGAYTPSLPLKGAAMIAAAREHGPALEAQLLHNFPGIDPQRVREWVAEAARVRQVLTERTPAKRKRHMARATNSAGKKTHVTGGRRKRRNTTRKKG